MPPPWMKQYSVKILTVARSIRGHCVYRCGIDRSRQRIKFPISEMSGAAWKIIRESARARIRPNGNDTKAGPRGDTVADDDDGNDNDNAVMMTPETRDNQP